MRRKTRRRTRRGKGRENKVTKLPRFTADQWITSGAFRPNSHARETWKGITEIKRGDVSARRWTAVRQHSEASPSMPKETWPWGVVWNLGVDEQDQESFVYTCYEALKNLVCIKGSHSRTSTWHLHHWERLRVCENKKKNCDNCNVTAQYMNPPTRADEESTWGTHWTTQCTVTNFDWHVFFAFGQL